MQDNDDLIWLKSILYKAALSGFVAYLLPLAGTLYIYPKGWDWKSNIAFTLGMILSLWFLSRRIPDPYPFVANRKTVPSMKLSNETVRDILKPYSQNFKFIQWILAACHTTVWMIISSRNLVTLNTGQQLFVGFFSVVLNITFIHIIFFIYAGKKMSKDIDREGSFD